MSIYHEEMAAALLDRMLLDPDLALPLVNVRRQLRKGELDASYVDVIGQTQRDSAYWEPAQAAAYLRVHSGLMAGEFAQTRINVGKAPSSDVAREENAQRLSNLHRAFQARIDPRQMGADEDGRLWWDQPVTVDRSVGLGLIDHSTITPITAPLVIAPASVPLEIGLTRASRTLSHLVRGCGVARWPYGATVVTLLVNVRAVEVEA